MIRIHDTLLELRRALRALPKSPTFAQAATLILMVRKFPDTLEKLQSLDA